jgi:RecB family exonuclease
MSEPVKLSASKIKSLQTCSWKFYCEYFLKLPKSKNAGASRGTVAHLIFELLLNPRHKKHYDKMVESGTIKASAPIYHLVKRHANKLDVGDPENLQMIDEMICVALRKDFHCDGAIKLEAETEFKIAADTYIINGFIDKLATYEDYVHVWDYKTSKAKFTANELDGNMQVLMYSLAYYKQFGKIPRVSFLFLRFPDSPEQHAPAVKQSELNGFEAYLKYIGKYISEFTEEAAKTDYAADDKKRMWLCGFNKYPGQLKKDGNVMWGCDYKFPFDYYALIDADGKVKKTAYKKEDLTAKEGEKIEKRQYAGCPRFNKKFSRPQPQEDNWGW